MEGRADTGCGHAGGTGRAARVACGEEYEGGHTRGCQRGEEGREREDMLT